MTPACPLCARQATEPPLWADAHFELRHLEAPHGLAGWMLLVTRRHVASLAELDDAEAAALGPLLRRAHQAVLAATGAARVYVAALGEAVPHVHVHLVPRRADDVRGFALFDAQRAALAGERTVDAAEVARLGAAISAALARR